MKDILITKNKSVSIKFIAVLFMIILHTFAFPNRIKNVDYTSMFILGETPIEYYIGRLGSICVGMFTFLSGYGLYISFGKNINYKSILKKIYNIYLNYWIIFLIFIPIGIGIGRYSFNINELLLNFIGIKDSYNAEWWFLRLYVMLLLIYPIFIKVIDKYNKNIIIILSFLINIVGYGLTKITYMIGIKSFIVSSIVLVLGGQFLFILGIIVAKYGVFNCLKIKLKFSRLVWILFLIGIILAMLVTVDIPVIGEVLKLIFIPIFIFILGIVINENSKLAILGKHSTNMWLTHSFFYYYLFQKFTFSSKYSILILLQQLIVTIIISIIINKILIIIKNASKRNKVEVSSETKCLHILPMNKLSGAEKMALILCKNMKEYEPVVVCGGDNLKKVFEDAGIKSYVLNFSNKKLSSTLSALNKIIKENDIKILHAHDNNASLNAYLVKKIYRHKDIKAISHIHNCYPWLKGDNLNKKIDKFLRTKYDYNIACGKIVYDFYKENAEYFQPEKTSILSNAMDIEEITKVDLSKSEKVIKEFNIPRDKTILGFIGRLDEQKGIIPFIKEFAKHKEEFNDCRILLVGNGSQEEKVKKLIKESELEELFILVGFQSDVYKFYPIIDVFFLPSLYEGLPMVLLEAMAFKKTVVSMNVGSISEVIRNGKTGLLIEQGNYEEFVVRLKEIKEEKLIRKNMGKNAFEYINRNYNINKYCEQLENIYSYVN